MLLTFTKTAFAAALLLAATQTGLAGSSVPQSLPPTPIVYMPDGQLLGPGTTPHLVPVAGSECPSGSGSYCSDELPYCCPGVSVDPYCATGVNDCTK